MRSLRWKIMLMTLVLVFVPVYLLNRYAIHSFDLFTRQALEEQMVDTAYIAGQLVLGGENRRINGRLHHLLMQISEETECRIQLLDPEGVVVLDTYPEEDATGRDLSDRLEVQYALLGWYKARSALTEDHKFMYFYSALPVLEEDELVAVAYVSRHTGPIIRAINKMFDDQRLVTASALALAALVSALLSWSLTRRLRRLSRAASRYAGGEGKPADFAVRGNDEIAECSAAFQRMLKELQQRNTYNREFVSTVTHELKAPLTAIRGAAELLREGAADVPASREKFLSNILHQAERMNRMAGELSELTRLDAEDLEGQGRVLDYTAWLSEAVERLKPALPEQGRRLALSIPAGPAEVRMMPGRMEQVLANLLDNAFRYNPPDGTVRLTVKVDRESVQTRVEDRGPGISEANLPRVFDRFFTTEPKGEVRACGSGLGLAIARSIVQKHGGTVSAGNREGGGAVLLVSLPIYRN